MATQHINHFLTWREVKRVFCNDGGTWTRVHATWLKSGATWIPIHVYGVAGLVTTGTYLSLDGGTYFGYRNYASGSAGSNAGTFGGGNTLSNGGILGEIGTRSDGNAVRVSIRSATNPGNDYLLSAFNNSVLLDASDATFLFAGGVATWTWTGEEFSDTANGEEYYAGLVLP